MNGVLGVSNEYILYTVVSFGVVITVISLGLVYIVTDRFGKLDKKIEMLRNEICTMTSYFKKIIASLKGKMKQYKEGSKNMGTNFVEIRQAIREFNKINFANKKTGLSDVGIRQVIRKFNKIKSANKKTRLSELDSSQKRQEA